MKKELGPDTITNSIRPFSIFRLSVFYAGAKQKLFLHPDFTLN